MRISIYLLTTSHTHLLLTTPTSHTHRFHPLSKIVIHTSAHPYCTEVWMTILESGWNLWVWLVGVVNRRWVWLVVRRFIHILTIIINFPSPLVLALFFDSSIPTSLFIFKTFFRSFKNKNKKPKWRFFTSRGAHLNCAIMAVIHSFILLEISRRTRWWCLKCVTVYSARDIRPFVMYCVSGKPRSSLLKRQKKH